MPRDMVFVNAVVGLLMMDRVVILFDGVEMVAMVIDNGVVRDAFDCMVMIIMEGVSEV